MERGSHLFGQFTINSASTNITTGYTELSSTGITGYPGAAVYCYNGGSQPLVLGVGASSAEQPLCQIAPGVNQRLPLLVPVGRLSLKVLGSTAQSSGIVVVDIYG